MTNDEKNLIIKNSFTTLWKYMWKNTVSLYTNKNEEITSETKFNLLKSGIIHKNKLINVEYLCENSTTSWTSQEWDFPKGRKNTDENDINCAIREFEEETGIKKELLNLSGNTLTLEEGFIGTNNKSYKNKYYIAHVKNAKNISLEKYQESEVSYVGWKDINELMSNIRDYQHEKKNIIINIDSILKNYTFYM
jgi:8-oxo-dGTP pyrophosphatase MutT (NUDIX family)